MGMGKTVQAIALVLAKRALCREHDAFNLKSRVGNPGEIKSEDDCIYNSGIQSITDGDVGGDGDEKTMVEMEKRRIQ
ncbi:hypothetical protein L1987_54131 [Smallanthus sonchifolius]|uniref:Uncharacterized protein n=1 Tax=Smallanthus sonchifolius TaxID=185202 RepID=A0ACB9E5X9_9ASTR|nr:hypothetical protein L1987_54131 [Smallanthus sonchifolius]